MFLLVLDNFRFDQWRVVSQELTDDFDIDEELYFSILPTATQYARNAIFSGLMPARIRELYPELWVDEEEDEGKNLNEEALIRLHLERIGVHLTRLTQAQADYIGVPVDGPYKAEHYRY